MSERLQLKVKLTNQTSGLAIPAPGAPAVRLLELLERSAILEIPRKVCAIGHQLELKLEARGFREDLDVEGLGKVAKIEASGDRDAVTLEFFKIDALTWNTLIFEINRRQGHVSDLLKKMRDA
ncbi:MAG: hypothetical protein IT285_07460 [Bdellovibrionales bacterium]|nr:hypothetical protein [Bdellovibrionales bacterium]